MMSITDGKCRIQHLAEGDEHVAIDSIGQLKEREDPGATGTSFEHMHRLLVDPRNLLLLVQQHTTPAGFLLAYELPRIDRDGAMVYCYEIAVAPAFRRQGIAAALIDELIRVCRERNVWKIWLGTEVSNTAARALYEKTGASAATEPHIEFEYLL